MRIVIAGGTGFIGSALTRRLVEEGHSVVLLSRNPDVPAPAIPPTARRVAWDAKSAGQWAAELDGADAVINLTGELIGRRRWSRSKKQKIFSSRVESTRALVDAIGRTANRPGVLINASAVGIYGPVDEWEVPETHPPGKDFLAQVGIAWEAAARRGVEFGVRVVMLRTGIVLARGGGALARMVLPFRLFIGGVLGAGRQWVPWVHREDLVGIILFLLARGDIAGPVNVVAPESVTMKEFSVALGKALRRPCWTRVPAFVVRLTLGEMSTIVLTGQRAVPAVLRQHGYSFRYTALSSALQQIYG